jgi:alkaline phosphatase D
MFEVMRMAHSRRDVMTSAAWLAGAALAPTFGQPVMARARLAAYPFTLGVASGDPASDGFVLWTRLAPTPMADDGGMPPEAVRVAWEVAEDEGFRRIVRKGEARAEPNAAHSVHVEVDGLSPGRDYFYRFHAGDDVSMIGRTRTTPAAGADIQAMRYAFTACQRYENGFYSGYRQLVADDPQLVLFLGDYIYEHAARDGLPRRHNADECLDLRTYRLRHALYKTDKDLQAAHAAAPWMLIWDDHEVRNNYNGDQPNGGGDPAAFLRQRAAAYQAYYEHMPLRRRSAPVGPNMQLYRTLDWGRLAQFQLVDCRQYRKQVTCGGNRTEQCAARIDPANSMLGAEQEAWLLGKLTASRAHWNVLAQQFMMGEARRTDPETGEVVFGLDGWDGYPDARDRVVRRWVEAKVSNPMAIGGDSHAFIASDLGVGRDGPAVAGAFVGGSMSSTAGNDFRKMAEQSPRIRFGEHQRRGYTIVDVDRRQSRINMRAVADATVSDSPTSTLKTFVVENGVPGFREA